MNDLQKIYPVDNISEGVISGYIDPETGEIIDEEDLPQPNEALQMALVNKAKMASATQELISNEIKALQELLSAQKRREEGVKRFLKLLMDNAGVRKLDFGKAIVSIKKNPAKLFIKAGANIDKYKKVEMVEKVDKAAIKADLKAGVVVDGCALEQWERLEIK